MSNNKLAFVFPAFTGDYIDHPGRNLPGFDELFTTLLTKAANRVDTRLASFDFSGETFADHELRTQYITYIYSCTASLILKVKGVTPAINAGYSMGIYAALFNAGAVSFETGLDLICAAFEAITKNIDLHLFGMGTIIGLTQAEIRQLIDQSSLRVYITNQNATHSFVVSGYSNDIQKLRDSATDEGALHTSKLAVSVPYHAIYLQSASKDFAQHIRSFRIDNSATPVISLIDQVILTNAGLIRNELERNLFQPLNWFNTMQILLKQGISGFIECGSSKGLTRNAKFVDGAIFSPLSSIVT
ncbi:MAG: ACP S-malonyltransferase [Bacteroidales bacterium]